MKKSLFIGFVLGLSLLTTSIFAKTTYEVENVSGLAYTPQAIVFEDSVVVFYQLKSAEAQVAFSVGTLDEYGQIDFGANSYIIDTDVIHSTWIAPAPSLLNGKLYLFGRSTDKKLIYNVVDSVEDLIKGAWNFDAAQVHANATTTVTELDNNLPYIAALEYAHGDLSMPYANKQRRILLAYYGKDAYEHFSYSTCEADANDLLVCYGGKHVYEYGSTKFNGAPQLVNPYSLNFNFPNAFPEMYIRNSGGTMTRHYFAPQDGFGTDFFWSSNSNYDLPKDAVHASRSPIGSVQSRDNNGYFLTHMFYRTEGSNNLYKAAQSYSSSSSYTWNKSQDLYIDTTDHQGISAVVFDDHAFLFYVENGTSALKYYVDTYAVNPPALP